jgi:hypothetical protein
MQRIDDGLIWDTVLSFSWKIWRIPWESLVRTASVHSTVTWMWSHNIWWPNKFTEGTLQSPMMVLWQMGTSATEWHEYYVFTYTFSSICVCVFRLCICIFIQCLVVNLALVSSSDSYISAVHQQRYYTVNVVISSTSGTKGWKLWFCTCYNLVPNVYLTVPSSLKDRPNHLICHFISHPFFSVVLVHSLFF